MDFWRFRFTFVFAGLIVGKKFALIRRMKLDELVQRASQTKFWHKKPEVIEPPVLTDARRFPYGPFQFRTQVSKNAEYIIRASSDLRTWTDIGKGLGTGEMFDFLDSEAFKHSFRFYRVICQQVSSFNVIGYASVTLPPGFSMIANPFISSTNRVAEIFQNWPDGTTLNKFDTRFFRLAENAVKQGVWTNPGEKLEPGEGAIFFNPTSDYKNISFVGEVNLGHVSMPIPSGFSMRSSLVPQAGNLEEMGFPIGEGDVVHLFDRDRQKYVLYPYENGKWISGAPIVSFAESFWIAKTEPGTWSKSLSLSE